MASGVSKRRTQKGSDVQELNLMPIMNLFITIIPMLLMITVTVHMALLSLNLAASGGEGAGGEGGEASDVEKVKEIKIILYTDRIEIREEGVSDPILIPAIFSPDGSTRHDYLALDDHLTEIKSRNEDVFEIGITPYPDVYYGTLIRAIDISKLRGFPEVKYERPRVMVL
jgi:hypothetical protein